MATLDELLTKDGFKKGRDKPKAWPKGGTAGWSATNLSSSRFGSSVSKVRPARTTSDVNSRRSFSVVLEKAGFKQPIPSNVEGRRFRSVDWYEEQSLKLQDPKVRSFSSLNVPEQVDGSSGKNHRRASFIEASNVNSKSSMVVESKKGGYSNELQTKLRYNRSSKNNPYENEEPKATKTQNSQAKPSFNDARVGRPMPAQDNSALRAITSMINSCVNQILKDKSFRSSLYQACISSLKSTGVQYMQSKENGVIFVLAEGIKVVERIITEGPNQFDLKTAFVNLNVITGLKSMESDDGHTRGIPCSHLAACSHLYLSILYKFQKDDKVSAKHLLQVFCDSPYHARTTLLPELWNRLFLPNFSHLKAWHEKKLSSIPVTSGVMIELEFMEKVYNDVVDMVTSKFAAYYKGWLMGGNKGSALPSNCIPFASVYDIAEYANEVVSSKSFSLSNSASSKTVISKKLYSVLSKPKRNKTTNDMESREEEEKDEVGHGTEGRQADFWRRICDDRMQKDDENKSRPTESGAYAAEYFQEFFGARSQRSASSFEVADHFDDPSTYITKLSIDSPECYSDQDEMAEVTRIKLGLDETDTTTTNGLFGSCALKETSSDIVLGHPEGNYQDSLFSRIPEEFICPLTGQLLKEPVTLESGHTFELVAIKDRFNLGNRTCPVTGQTLTSPLIPGANMVLKHVIKEWVAECFRNSISLASEITSSPLKQVCNYRFELSFLIIEQLLSGFSFKEGKENIEHLISLGGLQFLTNVLEVGCLEEKSHAAELLAKCIQADGCCRHHLAIKISKSSLLNLIYSKQVHARTRAASLLIELICLNRRMDITSFMSGLKTEDIGNTKRELLLCLQSSLSEERVLVAVLLLHLDLMEESWMHSVYKKEAVKCIVKALECCLFNKMFIPNCRRALLMLGGHFSFSGEFITETWLLKKAGYNCKNYNDEDDQTISEEESRMKEDWLKSMSLTLLHYGKKTFQETLSKCWKSGDADLMRVYVVTTAWLSHALASLSVPALQLSAFSAFMPGLKECLKIDLDIELKVLASLSLHNFSKILECRIQLITFADEIHDSLKSLKEVTWTAKHLYNDIFEETS